jgi:two-component system phosphate regulon sensor histidine kinase PhoR
MPFTIRSSTIRLGIFISSVIIAIILVFQLVWLKKNYRLEQKDFDHSVVKAIKGLYEDMDIKTYNFSTLNNLIETPSPNLYLARITLPVNYDSLRNYMQYELEEFGIFTNCLIGLYSADEKKYIFTGLLASPIKNYKGSFHQPEISRSFNYLSLYFPNRRQYILAQMNIWIISSAILLVV